MSRAKKSARLGPLASSGGIVIAVYVSCSGISQAADWVSGPPPYAAVDNFAFPGVPCSAGAPFWAPPAATAAILPWPSVWLGHFSGGRPYTDRLGQTLVEWRDEKVCFPLRQQCQAWVRALRRAYHRPEGYWTCLILRRQARPRSERWVLYFLQRTGYGEPV